MNSNADNNKTHVPLFTIISINKNNGAGLRKTLQSIESQTCNSFEVIVIDANSTDETLSVVKQFQHLINIFESESARGIYAAMNQGISLAKGVWTIFLNSGDSFFSQHVLKEFLPRQPTQLAFGRAWLDGAKGPAKYNGLGNIWKGQPFCHQALFTRTQLLKSAPFDTGLSIVADYKFLVQAYLAESNFEELDLDVCWIEPPGLSGKYVFRRLLEKYLVARTAFPGKPVLRVTIRQYLRHYRRFLRTKNRG